MEKREEVVPYSSEQQFNLLGANILFGPGTIKKIGSMFLGISKKAPLIVTDQGVVKSGHLATVLKYLQEYGAIDSIEVYDNAPQDPTDIDVVRCVEIYNGRKCDSLIGLGGGSPIDLAKGVRALATHPGPINQYFGPEGMARLKNPMPPLIAIPTTAGTGTEASRGAIITDTKIGRKLSIRSGMPTAAIVDPELTHSMPKQLTAATAIDALTHCIEAVLSVRDNPVCDALGVEGIRMITSSIVPCVNSGERSPTHRGALALGASFGALAFQKGLGVNHSIAHQLSTVAGIPHGLANAVILVQVLHFNEPAARSKYELIGTAINGKTLDESVPESVAKLIAALRLPTRLRDVGVSRQMFPELVRLSLEDWCHQTNPRVCDEKGILEILENAY